MPPANGQGYAIPGRFSKDGCPRGQRRACRIRARQNAGCTWENGLFFKLVLGGRRGFPTCGPERSAAAPGGHAGRGKESAAKAAVRRMACRSVCISFNTGYIIEDDVSCSLSVICPEPTRMCHKVTHKNLIDSSPLFRNSQIKIYTYATRPNIFCPP